LIAQRLGKGGNYFLVKILLEGVTASALREELLNEGVIIRDCSTFIGLGSTFFRAAIRNEKENQYLIYCITKWIHGWQKNGWRTNDRKGVLNRDLWESLYELTVEKEVEWKYVAGHTGHPENERCDEIALMFAMGLPIKLNNAR